MKIIFKFFPALMLMGLLVFSSCSTARKGGKTARKEINSAYLLEQLSQTRLQPDWFESKLRIDYSDESQSVSASATIRMKRDSLVWLSVRKLGFELARMLVTTDSVYALDRINNEYTIESLDFLATSYGLPADLRQLQDFILGNAIFFDPTGMKAEPLGSAYHLSGRGAQMESDYWIDASDFHLNRMAFNDIRNEQKMSVGLEEYGQLSGNQKFSYLRNLELDGRYTGKTTVGLKFSSVETDIPKDIRFEIPNRYTRAK
ncbi:MAG: DUF4292 domain-containing protein [Phaeodactylibacter sp.]|nr:DUF4292 domain-containing protein [Phaeodactylibacter sp.]MCB9302206.1 DUF4292 domain-containing protein [Lewinellaceae bacterium]HQU59467.1 DUF4292 domain-containing protein [Saprospiraceae bacterium]